MNPRKKKDQQSARADIHYEAEIPSREALTRFLERASSPASLREIATRFDLVDKPALIGLRRRLQAMPRQGQVLQTRGNRFGIDVRLELIAGRVLGHPDGFAFVRRDDGEPDIYLAYREAQRVLHGDRVLVRIGAMIDGIAPTVISSRYWSAVTPKLSGATIIKAASVSSPPTIAASTRMY